MDIEKINNTIDCPRAGSGAICMVRIYIKHNGVTIAQVDSNDYVTSGELAQYKRLFEDDTTFEARVLGMEFQHKQKAKNIKVRIHAAAESAMTFEVTFESARTAFCDTMYDVVYPFMIDQVQMED